jgi:hypothetical protein
MSPENKITKVRRNSSIIKASHGIVKSNCLFVIVFSRNYKVFISRLIFILEVSPSEIGSVPNDVAYNAPFRYTSISPLRNQCKI